MPGDGVGALKDLASDVIDWREWLGFEDQEPSSGEMSEGQELSLSSEAQHESFAEPAYNYKAEVLHAEQKGAHENQQMIEAQVREILSEIKQLLASSQEMSAQFQQLVVEQEIPVNAGKYHLNFFESFLQLIRDMRETVENSNSWMTALQSKKGSKNYWSFAKKFGTTFSQSNERSIATQAG